MGEVLLELKQVDKSFGGVHAIDSFSLTMQEGAIHGLIGPNGAGKTTIFNPITGIYRADSGSIRFDGEDITSIRPDQASAKGIARTFQNIRLFNNLSVREEAERVLYTSQAHVGEIADALELIRRGAVPAASLITREVTLDTLVQDGFEQLIGHGPEHIKVLIHISD